MWQDWTSREIDCTWPVEEGTIGLPRALARICNCANEAIQDGCRFIILSDRAAGAQPALRCLPVCQVAAVAVTTCTYSKQKQDDR